MTWPVCAGRLQGTLQLMWCCSTSWSTSGSQAATAWRCNGSTASLWRTHRLTSGLSMRQQPAPMSMHLRSGSCNTYKIYTLDFSSAAPRPALKQKPRRSGFYTKMWRFFFKAGSQGMSDRRSGLQHPVSPCSERWTTEFACCMQHTACLSAASDGVHGSIVGYIESKRMLMRNAMLIGVEAEIVMSCS